MVYVPAAPENREFSDDNDDHNIRFDYAAMLLLLLAECQRSWCGAGDFIE